MAASLSSTTFGNISVTALRHFVESSALSADQDKYPSARSTLILIRNPLNMREVRTGTSHFISRWHGLCIESRDSKKP